jgi:hypothetical protein
VGTSLGLARIVFGRIDERRLNSLEQAHARTRCYIILKQKGGPLQSPPANELRDCFVAALPAITKFSRSLRAARRHLTIAAVA